MGRGNDFRDRRRGRGDQPADPWGDYTPPPAFSDRPRPAARFSSGPSNDREAEAKVKWFNGEKGFGFVEMTDGSGEAFLHIRAVEAAGRTTLQPGTTLQIKVGQGPKGPQVSEVVSVDESTAEPERPRSGGGGGFGGGPGGPRRSFGGPDQGGGFRRPSGPPVNAGPPEIPGTVKWYDSTKGFGFVMVEGEAKDLFVHRSALERGGLSNLAEGQAVRVSIVEGRKGREVGNIEPA
jgi:CspA family cold shock protein